MRTDKMRWYWLIGCSCLLLLTSACFQSTGLDFQVTDPAQAQPTWTPPPTNTPEATPTQQPTLAPETGDTTIDLDAALLLTPGDQPLVPDVGVEIAQEPTIDPLLLTVTAIFLEQDGQQQVAPQVVEPTPEPQVEVSDPIALTATFIVERATLTASAPLTQAAIEAGIGLTTPTATAGAEVAGPTAIPGEDCIHEVTAADRNLYRISLRYGVTVDAIAAASNIANPDRIYVGDQLVIPGCGTTGAVPGPTSTAGALTSGGTGTTTQTGGRTHTVRQGETLFELSLQYGVPVADIAAANGIANINIIYLGQDLVIP